MDVKDVPSKRCEHPVRRAVYNNNRRTRVGIAREMAVWVGKLEMKERNADMGSSFEEFWVEMRDINRSIRDIQ